MTAPYPFESRARTAVQDAALVRATIIAVGLAVAGTTVTLAGCAANRTPGGAAATVPGIIETGTPQIFAEGAISAGDASCPAFTPDGRTVYFMRESTASRRHPLDYTIMQSTYADGRWSEPVVAPFAGRHLDIDPFLSRDGRQLLFASRRPLQPGGAEQSEFQMWSVTRQGDGWSEPRPFGPPVDTTVGRFFSTMTAAGTVYFTQRRGNGNDIYRSRLGPGGYEPPEPVTAVNTRFSDSNPLVSPDERVMVFFSARPGGFGQADLYVSQHVDGEWSEPRNLGAGINTPDAENCPSFSPDGRQLFFARGVRSADGQVQSRHIYYVSLDSVRQLSFRAERARSRGIALIPVVGRFVGTVARRPDADCADCTDFAEAPCPFPRSSQRPRSRYRAERPLETPVSRLAVPLGSFRALARVSTVPVEGESAFFCANPRNPRHGFNQPSRRGTSLSGGARFLDCAA